MSENKIMKLNGVSAIFCINMDYCTGPGSRWERMEKRLKNVWPCVQRFSAVTAASVDGRVFQQRAVAGNNLSIGGLGCAFSHLDLWTHIANLPTTPGQNGNEEDSNQLFLILEDDVFFQRDWVNLVNADLEHFKKLGSLSKARSTPLAPFFYMLNGAGFIDFTMNESPEREGLFSISRNGGIVYYTGGYIVNRATCQKLVEKFASIEHTSEGKITASDHMTKWLQETFGGGWPNSTLEDRVGNCFFRYPWLAMQECYESFIQPDKHLEMIRDFNVNKYFPSYGHLYEAHDIMPTQNQEKPKDGNSSSHPHHRLTLCTMFYDLGRREKNTARRQKDEYLRFGDFVLRLPYNLVIFTEPDMENYMWERRKELFQHESMPATLVVARSFDNLPFFRDGSQRGESLVSRARENWKSATPVFPHKLTADYSLMCCGRPALVAEVAEWNPFQSTHFGWIDFGCDHISNLSENYRQESNRKSVDSTQFSFPQFYLPSNDKLWIPQKNDPNKHGGQFDLRFASTNLLDQVLGTFFCGTRRAVTTYAGLFSHALQHAVFENDLCPTDEPLATWLNVLFPSLFQCFQTDWPMLLADACKPPASNQGTESVAGTEKETTFSTETTTSSSEIRRDYEKFMGATNDAEALAVKELLWKLLRPINTQNQTILSPAEISALFIEGFARLWYRFPERRQEECRALARHHLRFLERDFREHDKNGQKSPHVMMARQNVERIRYNWQFLAHRDDLLSRLNRLVSTADDQ